MLFTVVIPTFNRAALLERALESVWAQRFRDFEVIVVNNGSTDATADMVRGLGERVQLISQPNLGPGGGRNSGARRACGDYIAFLDDDDRWFPWTLASFAELIRRHNEPSILGANLRTFSDETQLATVAETPLKADVFRDFFAAHRSGYFVGAGMSMLRRDEFLKTGGYTIKPINCEDHDLILRMGTAPGYVQVTSPVTLGWRRHAGSATTDLCRSVKGNLYLVEQEQRGVYPGGEARATERRGILTRHGRPATFACLKQGLHREAWKLYWALFRWHIVLGRWKYLLGFPVRALIGRSN